MISGSNVCTTAAYRKPRKKETESVSQTSEGSTVEVILLAKKPVFKMSG